MAIRGLSQEVATPLNGTTENVLPLLKAYQDDPSSFQDVKHAISLRSDVIGDGADSAETTTEHNKALWTFAHLCRVNGTSVTFDYAKYYG